MILEEFEVQPDIFARDKDEVLSQVRDDPNGCGLACICTCGSS